MSNINQSQNLFALDLVQDLDDKTAATCSGGRGYLYGSDPDVILYQDSNQKGYSLGVNAATGDGISNIGYILEPPLFVTFFEPVNKTNFNDLTSSVTIKRGLWQFYEDENYGGSSSILGPGTYNFKGNNDKITSLKRVGA